MRTLVLICVLCSGCCSTTSTTPKIFSTVKTEVTGGKMADTIYKVEYSATIYY